MAMFDKKSPAATGGTGSGGFGRKNYGGAAPATGAPAVGSTEYPAPPAAGQPAPAATNQGENKGAADIATVTLLFKSKTSDSYSAVVKAERHQELMELLSQIQPGDRIGVSESKNSKVPGALSLWIMRPKNGG